MTVNYDFSNSLLRKVIFFGFLTLFFVAFTANSVSGEICKIPLFYGKVKVLGESTLPNDAGDIEINLGGQGIWSGKVRAKNLSYEYFARFNIRKSYEDSVSIDWSSGRFVAGTESIGNQEYITIKVFKDGKEINPIAGKMQLSGGAIKVKDKNGKIIGYVHPENIHIYIDYNDGSKGEFYVTNIGCEPSAYLTLEHYPPFPFLAEKECTYKSIGTPTCGELRANLRGIENVKGKLILFYVEPGSNLEGVLQMHIDSLYTDLNFDQYIPEYNNLRGVNPHLFLGTGRTDDTGMASINYILKNLIRPNQFARNLIKDGKIEGFVKAVVVNQSSKPWKVEYEASVPVKFTHMAQIVEIKGEGLPDKHISLEDKGLISGPGKVRVKRVLIRPQFDKPVEAPFELMPGDIINIDAKTKVEIVWVNGDRVYAIVPESEKRPGGYAFFDNLDLVLLGTARDTGFHTDIEKITAPLSGLTVSKGIDFLVESIPVVGRGAKLFLIDIRNSYKKVDLSNVDAIIKIRIKSKVRVEQEDLFIHVYNIEGSPDMITESGEEIALNDNEMVTISNEGSVVDRNFFNTEKIENEFFERINGIGDEKGLTFESRSKSMGSSVQIPLTLSGIEEKIGNMDLTLSYDPSVLEATEVIRGSLTTDSVSDYNILGNGNIKTSLVDKEGFGGNGSITYIKFNVIGAEGTSSPLRIAELGANRAIDYGTLQIQKNDGVFTVLSPEESRGNCDGKPEMTHTDVLCALKIAVGKMAQDNIMDMNGDGSVTSLDARKILNLVVGKE